MFPILTAPGVPAGAAKTVPSNTLAYVNLFAEAVVRHTTPEYRGTIDARASARRSTVFAGTKGSSHSRGGPVAVEAAFVRHSTE